MSPYPKQNRVKMMMETFWFDNISAGVCNALSNVTLFTIIFLVRFTSYYKSIICHYHYYTVGESSSLDIV